MTEETKNPGKSVVIVDDDPAIRDLLSYLVKKEGFKVETASEGQEAVDKIQALMPDLVLLDLMLPRMGGYEILRHIQSGETSRIPIMVITARGMNSSAIELMRREPNVVEFLSKPVNPATFAVALHRILGTKPQSSENPAADGGQISP